MGNPMSKRRHEGAIGNVLAKIRNECQNITGILRNETDIQTCLQYIKEYNNSVAKSNVKYGSPFPNQIMYWTANRGHRGDSTYFLLQNSDIQNGQSIPSQLGKVLFYILTTFPFVLCIVLIFWVTLAISGKPTNPIDSPDSQGSRIEKQMENEIETNAQVGDQPGEIILQEFEQRVDDTSQDVPSEIESVMKQEQRDTSPVELPEVVRCYFCQRAICGEVINANIRKGGITQGNQIGESVLQKMAFNTVIKEEEEISSEVLEAEAELHEVGNDGDGNPLCKTELRRDSWIHWKKVEEESFVSQV